MKCHHLSYRRQGLGVVRSQASRSRDLLLYSQGQGSDDDDGQGVCLRLDMLVRVASSGDHKTYRWRSSNVCYSQHAAMGSVTIYHDVESSQSNTQGVREQSVWFMTFSLIIYFSTDALILFCCSLLLLLAISSFELVIRHSSCYHVLFDQYSPFCLFLISLWSFFNFLLSGLLSNLACSLCLSYHGASRAAAFVLAVFWCLGM
jgi:hypothetical protein